MLPRLSARQYWFLVPEGARVLEIGCAEDKLLAALRPSFGLGVDFSPAMLVIARARRPRLHFLEADAHLLDPAMAPDWFAELFDTIVLSELVNDAWEVLELLGHLQPLCGRHTRLIVNFHGHLWEHPSQWVQKRGHVTPRLAQN